LREGDIIRFDIGCRSDGYRSDIARTAIFGEVSAKQRDYYHAILEGEERAIEQVRAGVPANEIFRTAVAATREAGIAHYRRHHVGHGIGLDVYDLPILNDTTVTPLETGMVLEVETPYYELGFGGLQVEDTILVTDAGHQRLTGSSSQLAMAQARRADRDLARGDHHGPLHGIPVSLKDLYWTKGIRTTGGSKILGDFIPKEDATATARLAKAGAVLVGKANMHEFAIGAT